MLKWCYRRRCCKSSVEAMLQQTVLQKWCRNDAIEDVIEDVIEGMLQKTLLQKITCAFVASKCTLFFFFSLSLFQSYPLAKKTIMNATLDSSFTILTRLGQKMTTNATFIVIF